MTIDPRIALSSALAFAAVATAVAWVGPAWDRFAGWQLEALTPQLKALGLAEDRLPFYLRCWGIALVAVALGCWAAGCLVLAPPILFLVVMLPRYALGMQIRRRRRLLRDQLVSATVALANTARAGEALARGLEMVANETADPLGRELRRISGDYNHGRPLAEAITETKKRLDLDSFTLFAAAIVTCLERGGRITDALTEISKSLQENQRLERKLEADTASGRIVGLILAAFPFLFLVGFYVLDPESTGLLFSTLIGQFVLLVVMALVYVSLVMVRRITALEV